MECVIVGLKPDIIYVEPSEPLPNATPGLQVALGGLPFGRITTEVLGRRGEQLALSRPETTQSWFKSKWRHRRVPVEVPCRLALDANRALVGHTEDISLGGALLVFEAVPKKMATGDDAEVTLTLEDGPIVAGCGVRFISSEADEAKVGIEFKDMTPFARTALGHTLSIAASADRPPPTIVKPVAVPGQAHRLEEPTVA